MSTKTAIRIQGLSKHFQLATGSRLQVFSQLDLEFTQGSFTAILGPSGCGKSTLLRMLAGLEPVEAGTVQFDAERHSHAPRVGLMLQQYPSLPWLTVSQNVAIGFDSLHVNGGRRQKHHQIPYYLSRVGLFGWQNAYPRELSGGMLQRLALARTLAMEPDIVLLDEPLGALDALTRRELQNLIRDIYQSEKKTFVMVTHDVEEALAIANRLIVLGPPGTGILYDSAQTGQKLNQEGLVNLLQSTRVVFAAGTWSGYLPVHKAALENKTYVYDLWLGMSDQARIAALQEGRVAGAFLTLPALAALQDSLTDLDPVIVHAFSRPAASEAVEQILRNPAASLSHLRWAVPDSGLETALIQRLEGTRSNSNFIKFADRSACVDAVAIGKADACLTDKNFARDLLSYQQRSRFVWQSLPEDLWQDLWTVLVVTRKTLTEQHESLSAAVKRLAFDASCAAKLTARKIEYSDAQTSIALLQGSELHRALARWGGRALTATDELLELAS